MGDDVTVLEDEIKAYADGTVARIRILAVPESEKFPDGVKYAFHYGEAGSEDPIIRFDNHHGVHELHTGPHVYEIDYPGLDAIYQAWRAALPAAKRPDW
ncbi:DUF6516 family protein [Halobacterium salinarum]|uniref:toxin-antitoxin system TumE family protein n=1 Tax=Halobacterium salinarum TaxID=2242 RepID=UPI002553B244|nr:DUF6516 family protein [Halobacterium salinarum]MDL0129853.1 DUF6516 family protein [Halobacterium salinarum]MDL0137989.1 DUF6516 family protein [Halobacterium salinarum]